VAFAPEKEMIPGSKIERPSPPHFSAGEKVPKADEGAELAQTVQSRTAPHPHSASLGVSLSPLGAGRGTLDIDIDLSLEAGDTP